MTLRPFLYQLIDYAGLFPPAALPLDEAIHNFAGYIQGPDAWMLAHFICPAGRLDALDAHVAAFTPAAPLALSILGAGGDRVESFLATFEATLVRLAAFSERHGPRVQVDMMEIRLPASLLADDDDTIAAFFQAVDERIQRSPFQALSLFYEIPLDDRLQQTAPAVLHAMAANQIEHLLADTDAARPIGLKMRCGGVSAEAFPSSEQLAFLIAACRNAGVRLKATAGLHHPIRRFDKHLHTYMHGFVNVFGAALLAETHDLDEPALLHILNDEEAAHFRFDNDAFAWHDLEARPEQIRFVRAERACSFGSCSFDEPRDDLRHLGWL